MLRRILFFFSFCVLSNLLLAQDDFTFRLDQSLNADKDSLLVSVFVSSTTPAKMGAASFPLRFDLTALDLLSGVIDSAGNTYNSGSYHPMELRPGFDSTYSVLSILNDAGQAAPPDNVFPTFTFVARLKFDITSKCTESQLRWSGIPSASAINWSGFPDFNVDTITSQLNFILRDSIGGTLNVVPASDTICQGSDVLIELDIAGENNFTVDFTNGTDNYIGVTNDGLDTALYTITGTLTGVQTFSITQITDVNGCVETTAANFTDDDVFIDATVPASNAGLDDSLCLQPKTYMLNGNNPGPAFNGLWTANSAQAVFVDNSQFDTDVTVDTGGYYYFTWTISSLIDGSLGACPSEEDSVRIRFFRQPSPAIIDSVTLNRCITSFPSSIANLIANPLDTGIGTWSIISGPGTASFGDVNNDTTSFTANSAQGTYDVQWEITWGNCPTTNDNVLINFELEPQTPVINSLDGNQCAEIANLDAQNIPLVGNLEFWSTTSSAVIAATTSPTTTATLPTYTFDSTFTFYWNSQNTTVPGVCPTKQDSVKITRFAQPDVAATITGSATPACSGTGIPYTVTNAVAGSIYSWSFPNGFSIATSNVDSTSITVDLADPSFSGNIVLTEITSGPAFCVGEVDTFSVVPSSCTFTANFDIFPDDTVCVGEEVTLVSTTAGRILGSTEYQWDSTETGGFTTFVPLTTDADTALATFSDPGNWQIQMTASDPSIPPSPAVDVIIQNIVVLGPPDATFVLNSPNTICFGDTVEFQVNITGGAAPYTVDIDTGGGSIIINNYTSADPIRIVPSGNTTYNLSSVSDGFSCSGGLITSVPTSITVNPLPNLNITTPSFPNLCFGDSILIGFSATGNLPYPNVYVSSSLGGQEIITITGATQNVYFTPSTGGLYVYSIDSVEDSSVPACTSRSAPNISGTATVTVNDGIDSAQFTGGDNICLGDDDTLTVTAFGGTGPYDYFFTNTFDISNQPTPRNITVSPASTTIYTLDSVRDNFNCVISPGITQTTTVNPLPAATFTRLAPLDTLCLGDTAVFDLSFSAGTFPITVDFDNDGASNIILVNADTTISIPQTAAGTTSYGINSLSDSNGCSESTFPANISVITNDAPVSATITGGDAICAGDNDTLNVTFTGGNPNFSITVTNIGVINPYLSGDDIIVAPAATTTYTLTNVTDANGCSFDTSASTTTTVNPLPAGSISGTASICAGASTNLTFNFTTGTGPFDVVYTDGVNNFSANGLVSGNTVAVSPSDDSTYTIVSILDQFSGCSVSVPNANITGSAVITVNPNTSPSVSINQSPSNPFCNGDVVTFTVTATDISASPAWQWYQNDLPLIGQNFSTFISPSPPLGDGDEIKVTLDVSAAGCASPAIVSDSVIIDIQANITPTVALSQTPLNPVCNNDTIQLIANITGAGASPLINWYQNGVLQAGLTGLDTISRLPAQWADGDSIRVEVISSLTCPAGAIANATQIINEVGTVVPSVSIVQTPSNPVCLADSVSFEAQFVGGGGSPTFDWYVNGALQIAGSNEFFGYSGSANGDSVRVVLNSSASCAAPDTAQDVQIVNKQANVTPVLTVTQTPSGAVCPGEDVAFTSTNSGGGTSPSVQWFVNGVLEAIGDNYTETNIVGATTVEAILTSNATCLTTSTDTFTTLINIQSPITPEVTINQNPNNPVCAGESVTFTTTASGQGSNPTFDWYYNGSLVSTSASYTASSVANGDDIIVIMTSSNPPACSPVNTDSDTVQIQAGTNIPLTVNITNDPAGSQFCPGQTVKFSLDASGQGSNPAIQWVSSFTSGTQSTDSTWTVTLPTSQNSYSVAVTVNSSASCVDPNTNPGTFTKPIIISNGITPTVDIVQTPSNPVCPGENVDFTVNSTGAGTSPLYEWYINGILQTSNSTGTYSSATLNDGDSISVRLVTTACGGGTVTAEDAILIQHQNPIIPQVEIIAAPDSVLCDGEFAAFFASATGQGPNPSYKWFVNGTQVSTAITYFTSFTANIFPYELVVELTRAQPCGGATIARDTMTVQVNGSGTAAVNIIQSPANPVCNGDPVNFTADAIHVGLSAQYIWIKNGTDTIGSGENITAPVNTGDNIEVRVSFFNPCTNLNSQISDNVTISTSGSITPIVTIVQDPQNPICPNETIEFTTIDTAQGSSPSYRWYRNGVLEVLDPSYSFFATTADDTIVVEMISSASCASPSNAFDTVITNFIKTELDTAIGDTTTFCFGDSVTLVLEDTNNVSIEWFSFNSSGADVSLGTADSITIFNTDSVYGLISNGRCSESTDTVIISVFQPYTGTITASGSTDLCFGDQVTLSVDDSTGYTHQWLYGFDTIATEINPTLIVDYTGSFNVIVQNNVCIDTIGAINVQVAPPIDSVVSILIGDSVFCEGDSVLIGVESVRGNGLGARTFNSYVQTPFDGIGGNASRSLEAWIITDTAGGLMGYGNNANGEAFVVRLNENGAQGTVGALKVQIKNGYITGSTNITNLAYHHVAVVFDGDSVNDIQLYVDGVLDTVSNIQNEEVNTNIIAGTAIDFRIGTPDFGLGGIWQFGGVIDEVRVWDFALDTASIRNNAVLPLTGNEPGLVGLWNFEDTTGGTAKDLTVAGNDGTLVNFARFVPERGFYNPSPPATYEWVNALTGFSYGAVPDTFALWVDSTGDYFVNINNGGCTQTSDTISIVKYSVDAQLTVIGDSTVCFGDSVELQAANGAGAIDSVRWFYGNYLVDSVSNPYLATLSGLYQAVVFNNVCYDTSLVQNVEVKKAIDSTLSVIGDSVLCADDTVILTVPKYGSSSLNIPVNGEYVNAIGAFGDFDFVHQTGNASFEFWLKLDNNSPRNHTILGNSDNAGDPGFELTFAINGAGDGRLRFRLFNGSSTSIKNSENVTNGSNFDQWNHCVVTLDNGNVNFYFNGVQRLVITDQPYTSTSSAAPNLLRIGGIASNFIGSIDELRIWKTTLTQAQISQNYQRPLNFNNDIATIFSFDVDSTLSGGDNISDNSGLFTGTMTGTNIQTVADNPFQPSTELEYQWFQDGSLITGAEGDSLLITSADFTDSSEYYAQIVDSAMICLPVQSRTIKIKENIISDTLFASPTEFCAGTDSARVWGQLDVYDSVEIFNLQSMTPLAILRSTADTFYVSDTDTVYGVVYNTLDGKRCTQNTDTIIITAFENPTVQFANDSLVICIGDSDTLFSFLRPDSVSGGTGFGTYTYNWSPGDSLSGNDSISLQPVYTANTSGIFFFTLVATDTNGCFGQDSIKIVTYDRVVPTFTQDTFTICFNDSLSLGDSLTVTGGKPGTSYKYDWSPITLFANPADSTSDNPLLVGDSSGTFTYTVIVTDSITNCTGLATITVVVGDSLRFNTFTDSLICFNTDSIQLGGAPTADGGTGTITYSWNPGSNLSDSLVSNPYFINPSLAATYTYFVTATDALGCFKTSDSINIEVAPEILVSAGSDTVLCFGDTTVQIGGTPTASNGFGTFGYQWTSPTAGAIALLDDPNIANPTISYTSAFSDSAIYIVTVYDTSASTFTLCEESDTVIVFFNPEIFADTGSVSFVCFDDTISLTGSATGGSMTGYTYAWGGDNQILDDTTSNTSLVNVSPSGFYNLTLFAFDNTYPQCFDSASFTFEVNDTLFADAGTDTLICYGEQLELGGIVSGTSDTTGSGGSGGFIFNWSPNNVFISNVNIQNPIFNQIGTAPALPTVNEYIVNVTDSKGCDQEDTISISVNPFLQANPGSSFQICQNDSAIIGSAPVGLGGNDPYQYQWNSSLNNALVTDTTETPLYFADNVGIDTVTLSIIDSVGCTDTQSVSITVKDLPNITIQGNGLDSFDICFGQDTTLTVLGTDTVPGTLTYLWNGSISGSTLPNAAPINDSLFIIEVNNQSSTCSEFDTINITVNALPDVILSTSASLAMVGVDSFALCFGGPNGVISFSNANPTPNASTLWKTIPLIPTINVTGAFASFSSNDLDPVTGNIIRNVITDVEGCIDSAQVHVSANSLPNATFFSDKDTICQGDTITLTAANGPTPFGLDTTYTFKRIFPTPANNNITCCGDTNFSFRPGIDDASPNILFDTASTYVYSVEINRDGCNSVLTTEIRVNPLPTLQVVSASDSICFGDTISLSVSNVNTNPVPINTYTWGHTPVNNNLVNVNILSDTTFNVFAIDTNSCISDTSFLDIKVKPLPDVSLDALGPISICFGEDTLLSLVNPSSQYTYTWRDSSNLAVPPPGTINTASYLANTSGDYFVEIVTTGNTPLSQCRDTSNAVSVTVNPLPTISVNTNPPGLTTFCALDSVQIIENSAYPITSYQWIEANLGVFASNTNTVYADTTGDYSVIVTDANGCIDTSAAITLTQIPISSKSINAGPDSVCAFSSSTYSADTLGTWRINSSIATIQGGSPQGVFSEINGVNNIVVNWNGAASAELYYTPDDDCTLLNQDTIVVDILANPVAGIVGPSNSGCVGDTLRFEAQNLGDSYTWSLQSGIGAITNLNDSILLDLNTAVSPVGSGFNTDSLEMVQTITYLGTTNLSCTDTSKILIEKYEFASAEFIVSQTDLEVCVGDTVTYTVQTPISGATYTFNLTGPGSVINNTINGQITIAWTFPGIAPLECVAINGDCSDLVRDTFSIQSPPSSVFNYSLDGGPTQITPIDTVCQTVDSITYTLQPIPNPTHTFNWTLQSPGGAATALGALDTTFLSVAINTAGFFFLEMTESTSNGCSITLQETVTISAEPTFNFQVFDSVICESDSIQIYPVSGNFDFGTLGWQTSNPPPFGSMFVSNDPLNNQIVVNWGAPGTAKWVIPTYSNGDCSVQGDTIFIDVEALPNPFITPDASQISHPSGDTIFCQNLRTFFIANPSDTAATYLWYRDGIPLANSDTNALRILESGTYSFRITTSGGGCIDSTNIGVTADVEQIPVAEITGDTLWCGGSDSVEMTSVNTALTYQWFKEITTPADTTLDSLPNNNVRSYTVGTFGTYYLVLTADAVQLSTCTDTSEAFVISPLAPAVSLFQFDSISSFCNNEIIPLNGNNAGRLLDFEWITNGQGQIVDPFTDTTTYIPSDFDSGNVSFEFIVTNFCNEDRSIDTADVRLSPDASYTPSSLVAELEELVTFEVDTRDAIIYSWVFGNGQTGDGEVVENRYNQAGDYLSYLIAVNEFNCEDSFAVPIHVTRNQLIYVPNVFSPNATNPDNKVMRVYGTNISAVGFEIAIFNRWGIKVFESTDLTELKTNGWNGQQQGNGATLPSGVYTYYIKGQFFNQESFQKVGTVSLIK